MDEPISVFVSYRRDDTPYAAALLGDLLKARFGPGHVFMDIDNIPLGVDFTSVIRRAVSQCDVLLAVIGPKWTGAVDKQGRRRLDDPQDWIVEEIRVALQRDDVRVIPVLVDGTAMPRRSDLPEGLAALVNRQALTIAHASFRGDAARLVIGIEEMLSATRPPSVTPVAGESLRQGGVVTSGTINPDSAPHDLEDRRTWQPASADPTGPADGGQAQATVVERRAETFPPYVPPTTWPRPAGSEPRGSSTPSRSRGRLLAVALTVLLLVVGGATTYSLLRDDGRNPAANSRSSAAGSGSESADAGSDGGNGSERPSSSDLGLPSGPPLPSAVLVANQQIDENIDLYTVDSATGATQTRLTTDAAADFGPVIAPDRTSVVYLREQGTGRELWVVATDGTGARPLFAEPPPGCDSVRRPAWNPADPSMLAVVCLDAAGTATLQLLTPGGGQIRTLVTGLPQYDDLAFSPDGTTVVYWGNSDAGASDGPLYTIASDGGTPAVRITDPSCRCADAIFSPDGVRIAFRAWVDDGITPANSEIFVLHEGASQALAPNVGIDQDPAWSPDGSMLVFKSDRADTFGVRTDRLWIMFSDGSGIRLLTEGPVVDGYAPAWSNR